MAIKKIDIVQKQDNRAYFRPLQFSDFVGQTQVVNVLHGAISSSLKRGAPLGHLLFSGQSGYGKTTLAQIVANQLGKSCKVITGYAFSKPSDLIAVVSGLQDGDVLFIDEIHRIKPVMEEILYTAMEDFAIDMVLPDGSHVRVPLKPFTLVGATTKMEQLTSPLKNRFVYKFHFVEYSDSEKKQIVERYLRLYEIQTDDWLVHALADKMDAVPREIHNTIVQLRDFVVTHEFKSIELNVLEDFFQWISVEDGGLMPIHRRYLEILEESDKPLGVKTIAIMLGMNELAIEEEVEPLLLKLGKIQKSSRGREII